MISGVGLFDTKLATGALKPGGPTIGGADEAAAVPGMSFAELLTKAASRTVETLHNAEDMSVKAIQGKADTRDVADAVMSAEQSLQAAISIRDKIVAAYLDVSRMAI